jgi:hypothetical protein
MNTETIFPRLLEAIDDLAETIEAVLSGALPPDSSSADPDYQIGAVELRALEEAYESLLDILVDTHFSQWAARQ